MGSAGKSIRQVVMHIDADITKPIVHRQFVYNMRYDDDESIKGDAQIIPKGAINLAVKDTTDVRRVEFLNATANEFDMQIMGEEGRAAVLREVAKGLKMSTDEVVPSRDKSAINKHSAQGKAMAAIGAGGTPPNAEETYPGGTPMGGEAGNTVSSRVSGKAV
jgi:hypothetical protein